MLSRVEAAWHCIVAVCMQPGTMFACLVACVAVCVVVSVLNGSVIELSRK